MNIPFNYYDPMEREHDDEFQNFFHIHFPHKIDMDEQTKISDVKWLKENFGESFFTISQDINGVYHIRNKDAVWDFWGGDFMFKNSNDMMFFKLTRR
jgi:hypothetical protein